MGLISRSELLFEDDYSWTVFDAEDPRVAGRLDGTPFSPTEGYELLFLINALSERWNFKNRTSAHKIEKMIRNLLPPGKISQQDVKMWIKVNWPSY